MTARTKQMLEERFEEIVKKENLTFDNLMELEDMPFVEKVQPLGDKVIVEREGQQYFVNMRGDN